MNTSGFYHIGFDNNEILIWAPNFVYGSYNQYIILRELKDTYVYPIEGWYWFNSEEEAYIFFNLPYPLYVNEQQEIIQENA